MLLDEKLKIMVASFQVVKWFASYLESRYQVACVENCQSAQQKVLVGASTSRRRPWASFYSNIHVSDLPNCLEHYQVVMYADDTVIHFKANSPSERQISRVVSRDF